MVRIRLLNCGAYNFFFGSARTFRTSKTRRTASHLTRPIESLLNGQSYVISNIPFDEGDLPSIKRSHFPDITSIFTQHHIKLCTSNIIQQKTLTHYTNNNAFLDRSHSQRPYGSPSGEWLGH